MQRKKKKEIWLIVCVFIGECSNGWMLEFIFASDIQFAHAVHISCIFFASQNLRIEAFMRSSSLHHTDRMIRLLFICRFSFLSLFIRIWVCFLSFSGSKKKKKTDPFYKSFFFSFPGRYTVCVWMGVCMFGSTFGSDYCEIEPFLEVIRCE